MTIKNHLQAVEYIHSFTRFGSQLSLDRMNKLLSLMNNPHKQLKFVHIAGTNGKGTTTQLCANILNNAGYVVGIFTSPYVFDFRERFKVNNAMIDKKDLVDIVNYIDKYVSELAEIGLNVTEFEMVTAIGFEFFKRRRCDIVCLEVGLGGRFDATNVISTPLAAIITSISMDHADILGSTLEKIAQEKAGIIKPDTDVVSNPYQEPCVIDVLKEKCRETNSRLCLPDSSEIHIYESDTTGSRFSYLDKNYYCNLVGQHQVGNAVTAIKTMDILNNKGFHIQVSDIRCGLVNASIPGRFHVISKKPYIVLDGAHNAAALAALSSTISALPYSKKIVVMGILKDKEYEQCIKAISKCCDVFIAVPVNSPRALSSKEAARIAKQECSEVYAIDDYLDAVVKAHELSDLESAIIVCGSFYLIGDVNAAFKKLSRLQ